ncbi:MAG: cytochrome b [Thermoplasmataceae archaeon]
MNKFKIENIVEKVMNEPEPIPRKVPDYMRKKGGGWYWTGAMIMVAFIYEVLTGLILLLFYQPANPYGSTEEIINTLPYGSEILTTHLYGAYAMIALVYIHLGRNLFVGAYKKPRQLQWFTGIILLFMTVGAAYFGYSLIADPLAKAAISVGFGITELIPVVGHQMAGLIFSIGSGVTLYTRFLGFHIIVVALIGMLFAAHFFLAEYNTIMPSNKDSGARAPAIDHDDGTYKAWYPYNLLYMIQMSLLVFGVIIIIPSILSLLPSADIPTLFSPFPLSTSYNGPQFPPWFLLFVYKELDFSVAVSLLPFWTTVIFVGMPVAYLFLLPYLDNGPSLKLRDRPLTFSLAVLGLVYYIGLSIWGALEPAIPINNVEWISFFVFPAIVIIGSIMYLMKLIREGRLDVRKARVVFITLPFLIISSYGTGILAIADFKNPMLIYSIPLIILSMIDAIEFLMIFSVSLDIFPFKSEIDLEENVKPMSQLGFTITGSGFGMAAVAILIEISIIPPDSVFNEALYGIGLGLIALIGVALIRLYRHAIFGE